MHKLCIWCGEALAENEEDFLTYVSDTTYPEVGLHSGECYMEYLDTLPDHITANDNQHFIRFSPDGRPLEPITRREALNEVKRLQNLCYLLIDALKPHDSRKAERYHHELES